MLNFNQTCLGCFKEKGDAKVCPHCGYAEGTPQHSPICLPAGTILNGKYMLGKTLGQGGFGITYLGCDLTTHEKVAIKEYLPDGMATRTASNTMVSVYSSQNDGSYQAGMQKFLDEAKILARFSSNPYIVNVKSFFNENGTAYYVMEYIEGATLKEYVRQNGGRMSYAQALRLLAPILGALESVHATQLLHRDISPDNIYVTRSGDAKLLDFGAARYNMGGEKSLSVILKPGFAPEEQYRSHGRQGPWTDIYALGATFYYALTGTVPPSSLDRLQQDDIIPFSRAGVILPTGIEQVLMKALAPRAEVRWQSIAEFRAALNNPQSILARQQMQTPPAVPVGAPRSAAPAFVQPSGRPPQINPYAPPAPAPGQTTYQPGMSNMPNMPQIPNVPPQGVPPRPPYGPPAPRKSNHVGVLLAIFIPLGIIFFFIIVCIIVAASEDSSDYGMARPQTSITQLSAHSAAAPTAEIKL